MCFLKKLLIFILFALSLASNASSVNVLGFEGAIGYTNYSGMLAQDGQTPVLRLAAIKPILNRTLYNIDLEIGIQTGNIMAINVDSNYHRCYRRVTGSNHGKTTYRLTSRV